jgi:hypothetical protein
LFTPKNQRVMAGLVPAIHVFLSVVKTKAGDESPAAKVALVP